MATRRDKAIEDVRWAMGFLSYVGAGASSDTWEEVQARARQHARELGDAVAELDGGAAGGPPPESPGDVFKDVHTYLGAKAPALAERFEAAILHSDADAGMREVAPCRCDCVEAAELVEGRIAPQAGVDLAAIAREILPGGHLTLTIYGPPDR